MNPPDVNGIEVLVNYVTQIRGQDMENFRTLITIFMGTIFGAILVAVLTNKKGVSTIGRGCIVILAVGLFLFFLFDLRTKYTVRREFCQKWLGCNISTNKTVTALIEDFSKQRYGLYYADTKDPNFKLRTEYIPEGRYAGTIWKHPWWSWMVELFPYFSAILVFYLVLTRPSQKGQESEISISASSIETEGKLKIN